MVWPRDASASRTRSAVGRLVLPRVGGGKLLFNPFPGRDKVRRAAYDFVHSADLDRQRNPIVGVVRRFVPFGETTNAPRLDWKIAELFPSLAVPPPTTSRPTARGKKLVSSPSTRVLEFPRVIAQHDFTASVFSARQNRRLPPSRSRRAVK